MKSSFNILKYTSNRISLNHLKHSVKLALKPIDYTRTVEIPVLIDISGIMKKKDIPLKILDISSPQILSLSLAQFSKKWDITYINPFQDELDDILNKKVMLGCNNLHVRFGDMTDPDSLEGLNDFDYIFSSSVFEHIHPENGGDETASKNIFALLKDKGIFTISVPYYIKAFNEYKEGNVYAIKGNDKVKTFFQRFYDEESLYRNIIENTNLQLLNKQYIGERFYKRNDINKRMAHLLNTGIRSFIFGRFFRLLSMVFMKKTSDYTTLKKPYLAIVSMCKNTL